MTKMTKAMTAKVQFANFCINHNFDTKLIGELCELISKRAKAAMADANIRHTDESMEIANLKDKKLIVKIQEIGTYLGLDITFPGCYAHVTQNNRQINLPLDIQS